MGPIFSQLVDFLAPSNTSLRLPHDSRGNCAFLFVSGRKEAGFIPLLAIHIPHGFDPSTIAFIPILLKQSSVDLGSVI
jgi:hypothetical protein